VGVGKYKHPTECPYECGGKESILRQTVIKKVCDIAHEEVEAGRYKCLSCQRTFRVYPQAVDHRQFSQRAIGMAVMLETLVLYIVKTTVYEAVQAMAERVSGMKQASLLQGCCTSALGADRPDQCEVATTGYNVGCDHRHDPQY